MKKRYNIVYLLLLVFSAVTTPAYANIGAPMIFVTLPMLIVGLLPIVLLEASVLTKRININFKGGLKISALMNIVSTLVGIPITWGMLVLIQMVTGGGAAHGLQTPLQKFLAVTWQAPWLIPYESDLYWMIPAASMVLLIPFFFASYFVELIVARKMLKSFEKGLIKKGILIANIYSYSLLFVLALAWLVFSLLKGK